MRLKDRAVPARLRRKTCLSCGYQGAKLQGDPIFTCPSCGTDLYARPALSYAEMEGLDGEDAGAPHDVLSFGRRSRWHEALCVVAIAPFRGTWRGGAAVLHAAVVLCCRLVGRQPGAMVRNVGSGWGSGDRQPRSAASGRRGSRNRA
jgi:predicted RNA-binding Zn-ribbon protein involved in translation (DUF1610 family)